MEREKEKKEREDEEGNLVRERGPGPGFEERRNGESTTQREKSRLRVKARSQPPPRRLSNLRKVRYYRLIRDQGRAERNSRPPRRWSSRIFRFTGTRHTADAEENPSTAGA